MKNILLPLMVLLFSACHNNDIKHVNYVLHSDIGEMRFIYDNANGQLKDTTIYAKDFNLSVNYEYLEHNAKLATLNSVQQDLLYIEASCNGKKIVNTKQVINGSMALSIDLSKME